MRILLLGAEGQLGCELKEQLEKQLPADSELKACGRKQVDLLDHASIKATIRKFKPGCIINAAAYTAVDKAESEPELAFKINAEAVAIIAEEAKKHNALLIHYSTDYVFDGRKAEPYDEQDKTNPVNVYGQSKLAGEDAIQNTGCSYIIFRTSWMLGRKGNNFARKILLLASRSNTLKVVNDQYGVPTTASLMAKITLDVIVKAQAQHLNSFISSIFHVAPKGKTTWYNIAKKLLELAESRNVPLLVKSNDVLPISESKGLVETCRPKNSLLCTSKLEKSFGVKLPYWEGEFLKTADDIIKSYETL